MRQPTPADLLSVWEQGSSRSAAERALLLLACAWPEESRESLAAMPIGRRDGRLLALRESVFGPAFTGVVRCPACGERLEVTFSAADVRVDAAGAHPEEFSLAAAGYDVTFRLPDSNDIAALAGIRDPESARVYLLERCILAASRAGRRRSVPKLPARVVTAVVSRMAELDPQADVRTALSCPACRHSWEAIFDIVSFIWAEIEAWAHRLLREVHLLASAYSWREADILSMSPMRRQLYLEMAYG